MAPISVLSRGQGGLAVDSSDVVLARKTALERAVVGILDGGSLDMVLAHVALSHIPAVPDHPPDTQGVGTVPEVVRGTRLVLPYAELH